MPIELSQETIADTLRMRWDEAIPVVVLILFLLVARLLCKNKHRGMKVPRVLKRSGWVK
jgi:hypothetical protein